MKRAAGWAGRILLWTVIALLGALTGLRLAGPIDRDTALGDVRLRIQASWSGEVDAYVPLADWGVRAHAFSGPLTIRIEPRGVDRQALIRAASGDSEVLAQAEEDARDAAAAAVLRAVIFAGLGVLAAVVLSVLIRAAFRRRGPPRRRELALWAAAPLLIGVAAIAFAVLRATTTFDTNAFAQPSFYARGAELSQLLQVSEKVEEAGQGYSSSVQRSLSGYAALLQEAANLATTDAEEEAPVVLVSDLHNNTLVLNALERLFTDRPVFFAGDLGHTGSDSEAGLTVDRLAGAGGPVVAVSGNHDSRLIMRRLARAGGIVLTEDGRLGADGRTDGRPVQRVGEMTVAGFSDPLEYRGPNPDDPDRIFSFSERPNGDAEYERVKRDLVTWFDRLPERPQIVMVHQNGLAQHLAKTLHDRDGTAQPLTILTGHDHNQHVDLYGDDIVVVDAGTGGAGGVFGVASETVGIATLQIPGGTPPPRAIDLINLDPLSGNSQADRIVPSTTTACDIERVQCHDRETGQ